MRLLECYVTSPNLSRKGVGKTGTERNEFGIPFLLKEKERDKFPLTNLEYNKQDESANFACGYKAASDHRN